MSPRIVSLLLAACLGWGSLPASAQSSLTVPVEVAHVSNPNLVPDGVADEARRGSATLFRLHPQYTLRTENGPSLTELTLGGLIERSSNTALSAHRSLPSVGVLWEGRGPTSVIGLRASLEEVSTRETEFADFGRVALDSTQRTASLGASWAKELSERTDLELTVFHTRVVFDTPLSRDYEETGASVLYRWLQSTNSRFALTASTVQQRQEADGAGIGENNISRTGLVLGYEVDLSEGLTLGANAGVVRSGTDSRTHSVGGVRLAREGERLAYTLQWARDVSADGTARGYTRAETFGASLSYPFTVDTSLTLGASRARSLNGARDEGALVYAQIRSELTPFWTLTAGLEHRRARSVGAPVARGHAVTLGLIYMHPDF
jgi:hypothetical protein